MAGLLNEVFVVVVESLDEALNEMAVVARFGTGAVVMMV